MMNTIATVTLPAGVWQEGVCYQEADLRPLTGEDEAFLLDLEDTLLPAQRTTTLLNRCLVRLGKQAAVTPEQVQSLTVGDREALLLHLRRLTLGNRLRVVLTCPQPDCGEQMTQNLNVTDLLVLPNPHPQAWYETTVQDNGATYQVRFRLPTGADQETVAQQALIDPQTAADHLIQRCITMIGTNSEADIPLAACPPSIATQVAAQMADLDPQAEVLFNPLCPACHRPFLTLFDTATYFFQELSSQMNSLYRQVHLLAFYYHWSETEILRMTARKRCRYLNFLREALSGEERW